MKPVNSKSMLAFLFGQMEKLDNKEITTQEAREQANLAKQANNILKYELDRVNTLMEISKYNKSTGSDIDLRNVESKDFE